MLRQVVYTYYTYTSVQASPSGVNVVLFSEIIDMPQLPVRGSSGGGDPEAKRRKIRKGTHSCWECEYLYLSSLIHTMLLEIHICAKSNDHDNKAEGGKRGANFLRPRPLSA